jgi:DNA-binding CsgD family transcriptional regulator
MRLLGREPERRRIERLLEGARRGESGVLVLAGEAGIGKTALLRYATALAESMTVVETTGIEAEAELEFSGLLDLCRPIVGFLEHIPEHQAAALRAALALAPRAERDRFAVGAALLSLLAAVGEQNPLLVVVDDAQWLDAASADALRFAARRLDRDRVGFIFAMREGEGAGREPHGFETIQLSGLELDDARKLLTRTVADGMPEQVADRLHAATRGNPLALVELPALLSREQIEGSAAVSDPLPTGRSIQEAYLHRVDALPGETRRALLVVAAATEERLEPIAGGLAELGLDLSALQPAEDAGLLVVGDGRARFSHPLVRSAVYHAATGSERRAVHGALAASLERLADPDRSARHLASAVIGPDEDVATRLAAAGARARERTAYLAAADAFESAARLSPERLARGERLADAAEAAWAGGAASRAASLVEEALEASSDAPLCARVLELRGRVELQAGSQAEARAKFEKVVALTEAVDAIRASNALTYIVFSCHFDGRIAEALTAAERGRALVAADGSPADLRADYALGRALVLAGEVDRGEALLERIVTSAFAAEGAPRPQLAAAATSLSVLERHEECGSLVARVLELARAEGPMALTYGLSMAAETELRGGRVQRAVASATEGLALARQLGQTNIAATFLVVLARADAIRGREASFRAAADEATARLDQAGMALPREQLRCSQGLLQLALGDLQEAAVCFEQATARAAEMGLVDRDVAPEPDLVETLARLGRGSDANGVLEVWTRRLDTAAVSWAAPLAARCRGLLAEDDGFEREFVEALRLHEGGDELSRARTLLCFGEALRRAALKSEAREHLREAHRLFEEAEAAPWADRARRELRATGERLRRATPQLGEELTPQELQVALQVAAGKTNKEAGAALFLSPKTVEFHLARVFRKLDLSSRAELIHRFAGAEAAREPVSV